MTNISNTSDEIEDIAFDITDLEIIDLVSEFIKSADKRAALLNLLDTYGRPRSIDEILGSMNDYKTTLESTIQKLPALVKSGKLIISATTIPYIASKHNCTADELLFALQHRLDLQRILDEARSLSKSKQSTFWKKK